MRVNGGIIVALCLVTLFTGQVLAAAETGEYLKYQEPPPTTSSWLATSGYIVSLLLTFLLVLGLAYLTSRFVGKKMTSGGLGSGKVYATLSLGPNRAVYVIEIAGKFMVLGVTEQNITLLTEVNSLSEIEQLKATENIGLPPEQFSSVFHRQLGLLKQMQKKFPYTFSSDTPEFPEKEHETDSRKR